MTDEPAEHGTWFARIIAVVVAFDVLAMTQVPWGLPAPRALAGGDVLLRLARTPLLLFALSCLAWAALVAFARAPEKLRFGVLALVPAAILQETLARVQGGHEEPLFQPAGALLGWVLAVLLARALASRDGRPLLAGEERRSGLAGATAVVGASYFSAAACKLLVEGPQWALHPVHVRAMTLAHQPMPPTALDQLVIGALGQSATLGRAAATFTLVVELGGAVFAVSPKLRRVAALGLVVWHVGLLYMTGICFYGGLVLLVALGDRRWPARFARARAWLTAHRPRAIAAGAFLVGAIVTLPYVAFTRVTQRGITASVVALVFCLAAAVGLLPVSDAAPVEPRPLDRRAALLLVVALAAVVAGLYVLPLQPHTHHR